MTIRNVIFDLDGTLLDSLGGIEYSIHQAVRAILPGRACPPVADYIGPPIRKIFAAMFGDLGADALDALERGFRASYDTDGWKRTKPYRGAADVLGRLRKIGARCFVATNKPLHPTRCVLDYLNLRDFFDDVASPDSRVPPFRSKDKIVAHLTWKHGMEANECLLVGDSADDRFAAESNGMAFAAAAYGYGRPLPPPRGPRCAVLTSLTDLPGALGDVSFNVHFEGEPVRRPHKAGIPVDTLPVVAYFQGGEKPS